ncbi:MAG TPA: hypothetical protein VM925_26140 [Labilithrix sp.]|jgi:hypothetical protein|nr:hypothetical protein [Labilithrix sp.]
MREVARSTAWRLSVDSDRTKIVIAFDGRLSAAEARTSAEAFVSVLSTGPHDVVWDLRSMNSYDMLAPLAWQRSLRPWLANIRSLGVIGGNPFVRLGATALASALGIPLADVDA